MTDDRARVRAYLAQFPPATRARLRTMRAAIKEIAPNAKESISYGIPTFKLDGKPLVYCAGFSRHTSLYPMTDAIRRAFADELAGYQTSKGTIRFPLDKPLRVPLVKRLVKARLAEMRAAAAKKKAATTPAKKKKARP